MKVKDKPKYNTVQNVVWMIQIAWKKRKRVLLFCILTATLEVLLNVTQLYIAPEVLSQVEQKSPMWMLLATIGVFTAALFLINGFKEYVKQNTLFARVDPRSVIIGKIAEKCNTAVIEYLFTEVGMNRVAARHDPNNPNSGGVMRKCCMKYEGTNRACDRNNQGICDAAQYSILRSEWHKPRHFAEGIVYTDDAELVQEVYQRYDEDSRLNKSQAARVEFLTTVRYIEKYLAPGAKILDVGAGAGEYSLHFARKGYLVSALELADANIAAFREKMVKPDEVNLVQGNALDLSQYDSDSFDVVLLFGPLYHLHEEADKLRCIEEAKRVCKKDGKIFFAFISNDMVILTMQQAHSDY